MGNQPLFPDIDAVWGEVVDTMRRAGVHPAHVYATEVCEFILTEMNMHLFDDVDIMQWEEALDAYMESHPEAPPLG